MDHKTTLVTVGDFSEQIDNDLVPLITALWKSDIYTLLCCQENKPGIVWIEFMSACDAEMFLNIIADKWDDDPDSLYSRVKGNFENILNWDYNSLVDDMNTHLEVDEQNFVDEISTDKPAFNITISVRFPRSDLEFVTKKMKSFVRAQKAISTKKVAKKHKSSK